MRTRSFLRQSKFDKNHLFSGVRGLQSELITSETERKQVLYLSHNLAEAAVKSSSSDSHTKCSKENPKEEKENRSQRRNERRDV